MLQAQATMHQPPDKSLQPWRVKFPLILIITKTKIMIVMIEGLPHTGKGIYIKPYVTSNE